MILCLLYHRTLGIARSVTSITLLEAQFSYISSRYETVFPGDPTSSRLQVCLTFDDGYLDFYTHIFPLLKKYKVKAVLAPITSYIPDNPSLSLKERLNLLSHFESPQKGGFSKELYCSWDELKEMEQSSLVQIACHSHTHPPRISSNSFEAEVVYSKKVLEENLGVGISSFIFPFGSVDKTLFPLFQKHFSYLFRIGGATNTNWSDKSKLYYRVSCDQIKHHLDPFSRYALLRFRVKKWISSLLSH